MVLLCTPDTLTHVLLVSNLGLSALPFICNYCEVNGWKKLLAKRIMHLFVSSLFWQLTRNKKLLTYLIIQPCLLTFIFGLLNRKHVFSVSVRESIINQIMY